MSLVILVIALIVYFAGCVLWDKYDREILGIGMTIGGAVMSIFALAAVICNVTSGQSEPQSVFILIG